ncbi:glycosyltransferase family A protein [Wenyingzhuangia sp. IMCC45533]
MSNHDKVEISYVVPFYIENYSTDHMMKFIEYYENFASDILDKIHFIFVDDCSPKSININTEKINYSLVRITSDIRWNQGGARNLGVTLAKSSKIILTDFDHFFTEDCVRHLLRLRLPNKIYTFRRQKEGAKINSAPNIFFTTKSVFYKSLGVDEEFCGNYGYEDIYFRLLQKKLKTKFRKIRRYPVILKEHKISVTNKQHFLVRDTSVNKKLFNKKLELLRQKDFFKSHSRTHLNFSWELVKP